MRLRLTYLLTFVLIAIGCHSDFDPSQSWRPSAPGTALYTPPDPPSSLRECSPSASAWSDIRRLYLTTEQSIHELITCGRVQVRLASSMLAIVLASNEALFRGDAFERVSEYAGFFGLDLETPFDQGEDGRWEMPIDGADPSSRFWVQFFRPGSPEPILEDPFRLESYLQDVHVETTMTLDEMLEDLYRRNTFYFTYREPGPLVDLLNGGEPLGRVFTVEVSIADIASLLFPSLATEGADFGPLLSLVDAEMISCVELSDTSGNAVVEYRADGRRDTIGAIAGAGEIGFDIDAIVATDGRYTLLGDATDLRFLGAKNLAGEIVYDVSGEDLWLEVTSDFGTGQAWPVTFWSCGECEHPEGAP